MSDPTNPAHYAGRACADIGERLSANGYQILKYVWRLGKRDDPAVELGKAVWYGNSEIALLQTLSHTFPGLKTQAMIHDLSDPAAFLAERLVEQPLLVCGIARLLWRGYNVEGMQNIVALIDRERTRYASS